MAQARFIARKPVRCHGNACLPPVSAALSRVPLPAAGRPAPHSRRLLRCGVSTACCTLPFRLAAQPCAAPADWGGTTCGTEGSHKPVYQACTRVQLCCWLPAQTWPARAPLLPPGDPGQPDTRIERDTSTGVEGHTAFNSTPGCVAGACLEVDSHAEELVVAGVRVQGDRVGSRGGDDGEGLGVLDLQQGTAWRRAG